MTKTLESPIARRDCCMIKAAQQGAKDPRIAETTGGMTEGLSFDMQIIPEHQHPALSVSGGAA